MKSFLSYALKFLFVMCFRLYSLSIAQPFKHVTCNTAINYTSGSVFERNLNQTLNLLSANAFETGFYTTNQGQNLDVVYGLVQCWADYSKNDCRICAINSTTEIRQRCSNQKEALVVYEPCLVRYSDMRFISTMDSSPVLPLSSSQIADDPVLFSTQLGILLRTLPVNASSVPSRLAVGSTKYTDLVNIYSMAQCTMDLAQESCLTCLQDAVTYSYTYCGGKVGCRIISRSCYLRFEISPFFTTPLPPPSQVPSPLLPETNSSTTPLPPPSQVPSPSLPETNSSTTGTTTNTTTPTGKEDNSRIMVTIISSVAVALVVIPTISGCLFWKISKRRKTDDIEDGDDKDTISLIISLSELKAATSNFSDALKLGEGGFGPVYKGKLSDGREIAVKRLASTSGQGVNELKTEVLLVAKLLHRNLVRLLGFCIEDEEKLLVYEYLPNGSLDKILFDHGRRFSLEWERRYKIIMGIARGLLYLHEDSQLRIIHRDLKASNILLDNGMHPRISDFGLAKLFPESQTQGNTNKISGTFGYMAPEYVKNGNFSTKSDVYSFGVIVLEIVTGRKNSSFRNVTNIQSYAWQHWSNGTALELLDPSLGDQWPSNEVLKCIHIGLLCLQEAAADRPTMSEIVMMLSSFSITTPRPSRPAFFFWNGDSRQEFRMEDSSSTSNFDQSKQSVNEVTISELDAR